MKRELCCYCYRLFINFFENSCKSISLSWDVFPDLEYKPRLKCCLFRKPCFSILSGEKDHGCFVGICTAGLLQLLAPHLWCQEQAEEVETANLYHRAGAWTSPFSAIAVVTALVLSLLCIILVPYLWHSVARQIGRGVKGFQYRQHPLPLVVYTRLCGSKYQ